MVVHIHNFSAISVNAKMVTNGILVVDRTKTGCRRLILKDTQQLTPLRSHLRSHLPLLLLSHLPLLLRSHLPLLPRSQPFQLRAVTHMIVMIIAATKMTATMQKPWNRPHFLLVPDLLF